MKTRILSMKNICIFCGVVCLMDFAITLSVALRPPDFSKTSAIITKLREDPEKQVPEQFLCIIESMIVSSRTSNYIIYSQMIVMGSIGAILLVAARQKQKFPQ